jgi:hypothetical protein
MHAHEAAADEHHPAAHAWRTKQVAGLACLCPTMGKPCKARQLDPMKPSLGRYVNIRLTLGNTLHRAEHVE